MGKLMGLWDGMFTKLSIHYIRFVYRTSRVVKTGAEELLDISNNEKFIVGFWHGDSYCYYPLLRDRGVYIVTTENRRGDYIDAIGKYFGYNPLRLPDETKGNNYIFKIKRTIDETDKKNLALSLDGPLGPYHEPQKFTMVTALATKRRMMPVSIQVKRKIRLKKRWDKYMVPLPFNTIRVHFHEPLEVKKGNFEKLREEIIRCLDGVDMERYG